MCKLKTSIGKSIGDANIGFKKRMNNHISRIGFSSCWFPRHVYQCGIKNGNLIKPLSKMENFLNPYLK